ncbi:unnamed protein product, partial [Protopolystoma xenopodis]
MRDNAVRNWFSAIEKGQLSAIHRLRKDVNDINVTTSWQINDVELGWQSVHFAAKNGHDNETPLMLALQSNMRDTVRKLIHLGAKVNSLDQKYLHQCVHRGLLPLDVVSKFSKSGSENSKPGLRSRLRPDAYNENSGELVSNFDQTIYLDPSSLTPDHLPAYHQVQQLSTSYDLELSRRKREFMNRLVRTHPGAKVNEFFALFKRVVKTELSSAERINSIQEILKLIPFNCKLMNAGIMLSEIDSFLRLIEACLCESRCSRDLSSHLSQLAGRLAICPEVKILPNNSSETINADNSCGQYAEYISRLFRKLVMKSNFQFRSGIMSHICRLLTDLDLSLSENKCGKYSVETKENFLHAVNDASASCWSALAPHAQNIMANVLRLAESLNQPSNVTGFCLLIGVLGRRFIDAGPQTLRIFAEKFPELADILVGWCVDPASVSRGIDMSTIYREFSSTLAPWWLSSITNKTDDPKEAGHSITIEMLSHLLEDSKSNMKAALSEMKNIPPKRKDAAITKQVHSCDPLPSLESVRLHLSVFSSISRGLCKELSRMDINRSDEVLINMGIDHAKFLEWVELL